MIQVSYLQNLQWKLNLHLFLVRRRKLLLQSQVQTAQGLENLPQKERSHSDNTPSGCSGHFP